jgi:hypothetical protein
VAQICGVSREMWGKYERSKAAMGTEVLSRFTEAGADAVFILTGQRIVPVPSNEQTRISRRESAMLDNYRACDEEDRKAIDRIALSAASPKDDLKKSG